MKIELPVLVYECDSCGACCRSPMLLEAQHHDVLREPRIAERGMLLDGHGKLEFGQAEWSLNDRSEGGLGACVFLGGDNRCGIYATRPVMCVAFQAGSEKCQRQRAIAGLPPLERRTTEVPTAVEAAASLYREDEEDEL